MPALYSEVLFDHFRNPRNFGRLPDAEISYEDFNPLCGDRIRIELRLREGVIAEARFQGDGCAISLAAASMLTELVVGAEIAEGEIISSERLLSALGSDIQPTRMKCALLALEAVRLGVGLYKEQARCGS